MTDHPGCLGCAGGRCAIHAGVVPHSCDRCRGSGRTPQVDPQTGRSTFGACQDCGGTGVADRRRTVRQPKPVPFRDRGLARLLLSDDE
jgi:hypothetical protein